METLWIDVLPYLQQVLDVVLDVRFMASASGLLVAGLLGTILHLIQRRRARILPYLPSYSEAVDVQHDAATHFYAAVHDMTMSVTEAWNTTHSRGRDKGSVETQIHHVQLQRACEGVQSHGQKLMEELSDYATFASTVRSSRGHLDEAWSYRSHDNYRTETYTVTSRDSDGNVKFETRTRQVYEDTDHWFTFNCHAAERAKQELDALHSARSKVSLVIPNVARMKVDLDKLSEAERMFLERLYKQTIVEDNKAQPTEDELTDVANQWLVSTRLDQDLNAFSTWMDGALFSRADLFVTLLSSRASYHYNTTSRSHSGPPGYGATNQLLHPLGEASRQWKKVETLWSTCRDAAITLLEWAQDSDTIESDKKYATEAIAAYEIAFPDSSIDVNQLTTPGKTFLIALFVGVFVAAAVFAIHPDGFSSENW